MNIAGANLQDLIDSNIWFYSNHNGREMIMTAAHIKNLYKSIRPEIQDEQLLKIIQENFEIYDID